MIEQSPDPAELEQLLQRAEDPLIARVANGLKIELEQAATAEDPHKRRLLQLAMAELHRAVWAMPCV